LDKVSLKEVDIVEEVIIKVMCCRESWLRAWRRKLGHHSVVSEYSPGSKSISLKCSKCEGENVEQFALFICDVLYCMQEDKISTVSEIQHPKEST
ncbi:Uncharacterized protein DAT39_011796, partial [Clarias magur]